MEAADTLRFNTAGSVDDGKSTLIGRLLFDAHAILRDQLVALESATRRHGHTADDEVIDFSLLTDGLIAEREQGITIDVAYRYFTTTTRRYIIADTPGHEQYTRNMVTGASTADLSIILVDAKRGLTPQSHRHAVIAAMLGIPHVVIAVNKMDAVGYSQSVFEEICGRLKPFLHELGLRCVTFIPMSALVGDMVVRRGEALSWYRGPTLMETLEASDAHLTLGTGLRFPVQGVAKTKFGVGTDLRGYWGTVIAGEVKQGHAVRVLPSNQPAIVAEVRQSAGAVGTAAVGTPITLVLDRQIDVSRGDMIVLAADVSPFVVSSFNADICWFDATPLDIGRRYWLKHTTRRTRAVVEKIEYLLDIESLEHLPAPTTLAMNAIARVTISTQQPLVVDTYAANRETGNFVLIDDSSNRTVAAGMIHSTLDKTGD